MPEIVDTTLPIAQLRLSPHNVRTDQRDTSATERLEASILEKGLLQAINVHPMRGNTKVWGVFAGGRRYRSICNLIDRRQLHADWPVPVRRYVGFTDAQLIELSIAENLLRRDLRNYELYTAIRRAHAKGDKVETIAAVLGQEELKVSRWLRMGELAPPIFAAFQAERISIEQAQAFAATEDQALQLAAWEQLLAGADRLPPGTDPARIRAALNIGDVALGRLLGLVGAEAYRAAGGRFELDLFADAPDQRGRIVDVGKLRELAEARLATARGEARRRSGREDSRFAPQPPENGYGGADYTLEVHPDSGPGDTLVLPDGDVVATIAVSADGEPVVRWWWASRSAKYGQRREPRAPSTPVRPERVTGAAPPREGRLANAIDDAASPGLAREANERLKADTGLSTPTIEIFRSIRRTILRAVLVRRARDVSYRSDTVEASKGADYFAWSQLRLLLGRATGDCSFDHNVGMKGIGGLAADPVADAAYWQSSPAAKEWRAAIAELELKAFMRSADLVYAFGSYRHEPDATKRLAGAIVAGLALERSLNDPDYGVAVHDYIAGDVDDDELRTLWTPTPELLSRIPREDLIKIAEPFVERITLGAWSRLKQPDLVARVHELVTGQAAGVRASMANAAARWVHPLLRFRPASPTDLRVGTELEAAE